LLFRMTLCLDWGRDSRHKAVSDAKSRCNKKKTGILVPPLIGFLVLSMTTIDNIWNDRDKTKTQGLCSWGAAMAVSKEGN
jgi:hypothetical protein